MNDAEIWALVERLGSQSAAARALGSDQGSVRQALLRHARSNGISIHDLPGAAAGRTGEHALYPLIARILERAEATDASVASLASQLDRVEEKLDELLARPIGIAFQPTHRRQADGGSGGRREQRQAQRAS